MFVEQESNTSAEDGKLIGSIWNLNWMNSLKFFILK